MIQCSAGQSVAVAGATGLIGSGLVPRLQEEGYEVRVLTRDAPTARDKLSRIRGLRFAEPPEWSSAVAGTAAVVNLAGERRRLPWLPPRLIRVWLGSRQNASHAPATAQIQGHPSLPRCRRTHCHSLVSHRQGRGQTVPAADDQPPRGGSWGQMSLALGLQCRCQVLGGGPRRRGLQIAQAETACLPCTACPSPMCDHCRNPCPTQAILNGLPAAQRPPTFLSCSAVGYYGTSERATFSEQSGAGTDFLAEVCKEWEAAAQRANTRVVILRNGIVLSREGGALARMIPMFSLFAGGPLGSGQQWCSWIHRSGRVPRGQA